MGEPFGKAFLQTAHLLTTPSQQLGCSRAVNLQSPELGSCLCSRGLPINAECSARSKMPFLCHRLCQPKLPVLDTGEGLVSLKSFPQNERHFPWPIYVIGTFSFYQKMLFCWFYFFFQKNYSHRPRFLSAPFFMYSFTQTINIMFQTTKLEHIKGTYLEKIIRLPFFSFFLAFS